MAEPQREELEVDVAIVGGGPAGLAAAIHLVQEARRRGVEPPSVALLEKAPEFGAHSLSGAVIDPRGLDALIPDWRAAGAPVEGDVEAESFMFLTPRRAFRAPWIPPQMNHHGGVIVSLQKLAAWLAARAEELEINLFPGFAGAALLREGGRIVGVRTGDRGLDRKGGRKGNYEAGYDVRARVTLLADGVRGNLSQQLIREERLAEGRNPMIYAGGVKEVWRLPAGRVRGGVVRHTLGFPLREDTFGGAFIYEMKDDLLALGIVAGLDSPDPRLNLHELLQRLKTHPFVRSLIDGGEAVSYGAKALPEGGWWALPRLAADGALLLGDAAGFVNTMRLKGVHLAIESGIAAAETILDGLAADDLSAARLGEYETRMKEGPAGRELRRVRNFRQPYQDGLIVGALHTGAQMVSGGRGLYARHPAREDHELTQRLLAYKGAPRPDFVPDGKTTFDKMADVYLSGTRHEENQPAHLVVADPSLCADRCAREYGNPCVSFCPAGVYEMAQADDGGRRLQLNFSNCVHCKVCDIADPYGVIVWTPPEGGDGPRYKTT